MDKCKVNQEVVLMRKFVKQARIHVINKCTKQKRILERQKGNAEQPEKSKRKLERLLLEINILKKIKPDLVSRMALLKEKDWEAVLKEKNIPLEERCFAMLAIHPSVQAAVEKFYSENEKLLPKIAFLMQDWEQKSQRANEIRKYIKNKQVINKEVKKNENSQSIQSRLRTLSMINSKELWNLNKTSPANANSDLFSKNCTLLEKDELKHLNLNISENNVSQEDLEIKNDIHETSGNQKKCQSKISENFSNNLQPIEVKKTSDNEMFSNDDHQSEKDSVSMSDEDLPNLHDTVSPTKNLNLNTDYPSFKPKPDTNSKLKAVTILNLNELQDLDEITIENSNTDMDEETDEHSKKQKKDPFFLREGEISSENDDDKDERQDNRKQNFSTFEKKPFNNFSARYSKNIFHRSNNEFHQNKKFKPFTTDKETHDDIQRNKYDSIVLNKNLKGKAFIQNPHKDSKNSYPSKHNSNGSGKKAEMDDKPLHPSWEAKRKLKEAANAKFQGKRIVF
ncbi:uncharacterized protein NPIL_636531 [Nephila pilipes]|uniref:Serum response factor-binding protein 1 n=1 Tax=Nephila pilipes TaxID=299642 RepID=A0A8X6TTZ4_NEPPI|nr:uncharacterized protein NPIL_636531 [Nephila pilipes]